MANLVEKEKMQILVTGLIKGFTILEILIVLAIISISGTSFYLILNQPKSFDIYEQTFNEYKTLSIYSGNSYAFTKDSIKILNKTAGFDLKIQKFREKLLNIHADIEDLIYALNSYLQDIENYESNLPEIQKRFIFLKTW